MASREVVMFTSNFLLQAVHLRREEFHRTAAFRAYHVMMAPAIVLVLIARATVMKSELTCQSAFGQQFKCAIHSGKSELGIRFLYQSVRFTGGTMFPRLLE